MDLNPSHPSHPENGAQHPSADRIVFGLLSGVRKGETHRTKSSHLAEILTTAVFEDCTIHIHIYAHMYVFRSRQSS